MSGKCQNGQNCQNRVKVISGDRNDLRIYLLKSCKVQGHRPWAVDSSLEEATYPGGRARVPSRVGSRAPRGIYTTLYMPPPPMYTPGYTMQHHPSPLSRLKGELRGASSEESPGLKTEHLPWAGAGCRDPGARTPFKPDSSARPRARARARERTERLDSARVTHGKTPIKPAGRVKGFSGDGKPLRM